MKVFLIPLMIIGFFSTNGFAADHIDGVTTVSDPATDITDVYAWLQNEDSLNLIMNVSPLATESSQFSNSAQYVFRINNSASYGASSTETLIICTFSTEQNISCSVDGENMVSDVDASSESGVVDSATDTKFRVFAGLRNDPFYFDLENFNSTRQTVLDNASSLNFDGAGCPELDDATRSTLVATVTGSSGGAADTNVPGQDFFTGANVLSIVIQVNRSIINGDGAIYGVSASTHRQ